MRQPARRSLKISLSLLPGSLLPESVQPSCCLFQLFPSFEKDRRKAAPFILRLIFEAFQQVRVGRAWNDILPVGCLPK
tara:strand:- start:2545 stop:2778 length:234 start_codon:yes stop_codon:yes gene_type:complete